MIIQADHSRRRCIVPVAEIDVLVFLGIAIGGSPQRGAPLLLIVITWSLLGREVNAWGSGQNTRPS